MVPASNSSMKMSLRVFILTIFLLSALGALLIDGFRPQVLEPIHPRPEQMVWSGEMPLMVDSLATIVGNSKTEAEALARLGRYFDKNARRLALVFSENDPQRLKALFVMYLVHTAVPYNKVDDYPNTLLKYVKAPASHCGVYSEIQLYINDALGLESRMIGLDDGWHGLIEVKVGGDWEIFDSTLNEWIDTDVEALLAKKPRKYRTFYTPMTDPRASRAFRESGLNSPVLRWRAHMPFWGIVKKPRKVIVLQLGKTLIKKA